MKKFLLFFTGLIFSLLFFNFKTYAQEEFPTSLYKIDYTRYELYQENYNTYEYLVHYYTPLNIFENIGEYDYFLIDDNLNQYFRKGINRNTNSYVFEDKHVYITDGTAIILRVTVLKSFVNGGFIDGDVESLFSSYLTLYVYFYEGGNPDYTQGFLDGYEEGKDEGYEDGYDKGYDQGHLVGYEEGQELGYTVGYNDGYNLGYDIGYDEGVLATKDEAYQTGYNKGAEEAFISKLHIWIVPAMILVIVTGIFVGYRRKDE